MKSETPVHQAAVRETESQQPFFNPSGEGAFFSQTAAPVQAFFQPPIQREEGETEFVQRKSSNRTGLPDKLKTGVENLSGMSMDDVKVYNNSPKPAQLHAHAYAQGSRIHIAPGQEKHLPHEAWHVVQQKQGRVKPTRQLKGKVNINDDAGLEREADVMGAKAMQMRRSDKVSQTTQEPVQRQMGTVVQRNDAPPAPGGQQQQQIQGLDNQEEPEATSDYLRSIRRENTRLIAVVNELAIVKEEAESSESIEELEEVKEKLVNLVDHAKGAEDISERIMEEVRERGDPDREEIERIFSENQEIIHTVTIEQVVLQERIPSVAGEFETHNEKPDKKLSKAQNLVKKITPSADTNPWRLRAEAVGHMIAGGIAFAIGGTSIATAIGAPVGLVLGILGGGQFAIALLKIGRSFMNLKDHEIIIGSLIGIEAVIWGATAAILTIATGGAWPAIVSGVGAGIKYLRGFATMFGGAREHPKLTGLIQGIEAIIGIVSTVGNLIVQAAAKGAVWIAKQAAGLFGNLVKTSRGAGTAAGKQRR